MTGNDTNMSIQPTSRGADNQDHYQVRERTSAELERTERQLKANLALIDAHSPAQGPITSHLRAIDAELAERAGNQQASQNCDPLAALSEEYGNEWNMRHPGKYVADHRWLDVTLISDSAPGLAEKLHSFTELIRDLP